MDSGEEAICEEYASSLEDLTFNSKPLINVLTMLAEENSQFAPNITNLIKNRIYQVPQQVKLPSLYLLDSIVKNVGGDYLHLVAQILEKTFTSVFEKADEKVRRDLYKLRHTWSQYFPAKLLYELDVAVNKFDPGWPIPTPPSPSIHINPKFLKKAENTSGIPSLTTDMSKPEEHQVLVDHQHRLTELERLQEEQLKLTDQEIQEHQMKRDLLLKKQQQERQLLLQQQQQQILQLRLQPDSQELSNGPTSSGAHVPVSTKGETTPNVQDTAINRDPRLRRTEQQLNVVQEPLHKLAVETSPVVVPESKPLIQPSREPLENQERIPGGLSRDHFNDSSGKTQFVRTSDGPLAQKTIESNHAVQNTTVKRLQHIVRVEPPIDKASRVEPRMHHDNREVTDSPHYDEVHRPQKPHYSRRRRNSGDWSGTSPSYNSVSEESDERHKTGFSRRKPGRGRRRRRSAEEQRDKEKSDRGRGRNPKGRKRIQEPGNDRYKHASRGARRHEGPVHMEEVRPPFRDEQWPNDRDFHRRSDQPYGDNWRRDPREFSHGNENMGPGPGVSERLPLRERMEVESNSPVPFEARFAINHGQDNPMQGQEDFVRVGSPGMPGPRFGPIGPDQERTDNLVQFEHHFVAPDPEHLIREDGRTQFEPRPFAPLNADRPMLSFHNDPNDLWDKPHPEEPLAKKPRPLLSDVEIDVLRGRRGTSPPNRGPVSQPMSQEGFHNYPLDRSVQEPMEVLLPPDEHPFPRHPEAPLIHGPPERNFHRDFGAPHRKGEFRPRSPPLDPHQEWSPGFEIPRELMLDRQSEIMRQAERRLQAGDLTAEQHHELVDKLQQLYDLQRHPGHTMFPPEGMLPHPEHRAGPIIQPRMEELPLGQGGHIEGPPMGPRRPLPPRGEGSQEHGMMPLGGPIMGPDELPFPNDGFRGPPLEHNRPLAGHPVSMEGPIIRQERPLDSRLEGGPNPTFVHGAPMDDYHRPSRSQDSTAGLPPKQRKGQASPPNTPNTMMEKQAVDDLFRRLMLVGIIKVTPEPGSDSPKHAPSPAPPPPAPEIQIPQPLPAPAMPVLPLVAPQQPPQEDMTIPVIKLIPEELKRRHVGVITVLYEGLQCSSCGLRFPGEAATIYREHLDWHFRKNRREKDGKRIAHRQWYFTVKDWLSYEEISDPEERARSSFFDVNLGALDSPDPLASKEGTEISCPVLSGDSETEAACDICFEKFEQFWEETNEEWHYKAAVRVDGKTYHSLCYQDAKESQIHAEEEEDEDEGSPDVSMETDADGKSPEVDKNKSQDVSEDQQVKAPVDRKSEKDSRIVPEKTDEPADSVTAKNSRGKVVGVGDGKKGNDSVISSTDDNKDTETKGDQ